METEAHKMDTEGIKIIFQDVDGCLNPADGEPFSAVPDAPLTRSQISMLEAINTALEASSVDFFVINSGRPWSMMHHLLDALPSPKARYVLMEHACVLYDRITERYLDCARLAAELGMHPLAARYHEVDTIHRLTRWYLEQGQSALEAHYETPLPSIEKVGNFSFEIPKKIDGDELLKRFESMARQQLGETYANQLQFLRSDRYIDILPGIHKLDGIHLVSALLRIDLDHALAVGDYLNDLPVFEEFHRVLCPANAHPRIQELARSKGTRGHVSEAAYGVALLELFEQL